MKTRFLINSEVFMGPGPIEKMYQYYEDNYRKRGFVLNKAEESVYKEFDREIQLNEGDRVDLYGLRIVDWKCVDLIDDVIIYALDEE